MVMNDAFEYKWECKGVLESKSRDGKEGIIFENVAQL